MTNSYCDTVMRDSSTNALMSLDFYPKGHCAETSSDRKILERIIPPPSGGRDKLHFVRFTTALRAWYNSSSKLQYTLYLKLLIIPLTRDSSSNKFQSQMTRRDPQVIQVMRFASETWDSLSSACGGIIRLTLQTSLRSFSASLITFCDQFFIDIRDQFSYLYIVRKFIY